MTDTSHKPTKCTACESTNVQLVHTGADGVVVMVGMSCVQADFYLCFDCGFGQLWMNSDNLKKVRKKYLKT